MTDGTAAGTVHLPVQVLDNHFSSAAPLVAGDRLLFADPLNRYQITDGTAAGTVPLLAPDGQPLSILYGHGAVLADHVLLGTSNGFGPCFTWDGHSAAVEQVANVLCGGPFFAAGPRLYFTGSEPHTGAELWVFEEK